MQLQLIKWFFANHRVYLFGGLHLGAFVARACAQPYRGTSG
jgi:hypothetical protein